MKKRGVLVIVMLLALTLLLAPVASADEFSGNGTISARGVGLAILRGSGRVEIDGHGVGLVWVKGAESLDASGEGHKWEIPERGATVFLGWSGTVLASGHGMTVWVAGGLIDFTAKGTGTVYLRGRGAYVLNHRAGEWSSTGSTLGLEADPSEA
jgi:hypothetical protein